MSFFSIPLISFFSPLCFPQRLVQCTDEIKISVLLAEHAMSEAVHFCLNKQKY